MTYEIRSEKSWITLDLLQRVVSCCQQPSYTIFPVLPYNCEGQLKSNTTANLTACIIRIQRTRDTGHYRQCVVSINYHAITTYLVLPLDLLPSVCPLTTPWRISHTSQLFFLSSPLPHRSYCQCLLPSLACFHSSHSPSQSLSSTNSFQLCRPSIMNKCFLVLK